MVGTEGVGIRASSWRRACLARERSVPVCFRVSSLMLLSGFLALMALMVLTALSSWDMRERASDSAIVVGAGA